MPTSIATSSLLWLPFTLGIYWLSAELYRRAGKTPPAKPHLADYRRCLRNACASRRAIRCRL